MLKNVAVQVKNLSKCYSIYDKPQDRLKQALFPGRKKYYREFWALRDISFTLKKGEAFGVIGRNGSGKSTLLQLICNTLLPTSGSLEINGRVAALLELGAGFNPEFTGRDNVYLNGAILGFTRREMDAYFDEIVDFADIGDFISQPVKTYSSGMFVRLAFAVQAIVKPDILIVDEALSVGDIFFQQKCHQRIAKLLDNNTSIILVSHDMPAILQYSNQVMLLNQGQCLFIGSPNEGVERYYQLEQSLFSPLEAAPPSLSLQPMLIDPTTNPIINSSALKEDPLPWPLESCFLNLASANIIGFHDVAFCTAVALCNASGEPLTVFEMGDTAYFYYEYELIADINVPIGGIIITDRMNVNVHGKNSIQHLLKAPPKAAKGQRLRFCQSICLSIAPGEYVFQVGLAQMLAEDYARVNYMEHSELNSKAREILRVQQAGRFTVTEKSQGVRIPHHGYADLQGHCAVHVLEKSTPSELAEDLC